MATATRRLIIDPNAQIPISVNDPLMAIKDDYMQGRLRITPGAAEFPTLEERQQGRIGSDISLRPSVATTPNISPFPLGCPAGMYQQGDVCIPNVDMIPGADKFPRVAGAVFPSGHILDVIPPTDTYLGEDFYIQCLMENEGSVEGKFHLKITIPSLNIEDETQRVRVPRFSKGLLYKRIRMPVGAASLESIEATAEISHDNEEEQHLSDEPRIVDDELEFEIPGPTAEPPDEETPPGEECITVSGKSYCTTNDPNRVDCITIGNRRFCTQELQPDTQTPNCPSGTAFDSCSCKCVGPNYPEVQCLRACNECPVGETFNYCLNRCIPVTYRIAQCPPDVDMGPPSPPEEEPIPDCPTGQRWSDRYDRCVPIYQEPEECPPGQHYSSRYDDCVPNYEPPEEPEEPEFEFHCSDRACREEFDGACWIECRNGPNAECLDCLSTCCGRAFHWDDPHADPRICNQIAAVAGSAVARAGGCGGSSGGYVARRVAQRAKKIRRSNYSARINTAYAASSCITATLAKLYQLSKQYTTQIRFVNFNALHTQLSRNRVDLANTAIVWCPIAQPDSFSVNIENKYYSPSELVDENDLRKAALTTIPRVAAPEGTSVKIAGVNFAPYESVDITMEMKTYPVDSTDNRRSAYAGKTATKSAIVRADKNGGINTTMRTFDMPSGVRGEAMFTGVGTRSQKIASHKVTVT